MSALLDFFVAPADPRPGRERRRPPVVAGAGGAAPRAFVLGAPRDVGVGRSVALELRRRRGAGCAVVGLWRAAVPAEAAAPEEGGDAVAAAAPPHGPAAGGMGSRAAHRLADRLRAHSLDAAPAGRLVVVELPPDAEAAAARWRRVDAVADEPAVCVLAAALPSAFEPLVREAALVAVPVDPGGDAALEALVRAELAAIAGSLVVLPRETGLAARLAAGVSFGRRRPAPELRAALGRLG